MRKYIKNRPKGWYLIKPEETPTTEQDWALEKIETDWRNGHDAIVRNNMSNAYNYYRRKPLKLTGVAVPTED